MLSIYLKPTNYCNIGCDHCYLPIETREDKHIMSQDTLLAVATMARDMAQREGHDGVHFIWHGGEPLVLSPHYFIKAQAPLREGLGDMPFTQSLQTSLIPYRDEWSSVIMDLFDGHIGSSVDFTQRQVKSSPEAYLDLWMGKVKQARSHGHFVLPGMVPTRHEVDNAVPIYQWFADNGFLAFNVDRYSKVHGVDISWPHNHEHSRFLRGLFDAVVSDLLNRGQALAINVVIAGINAILFDQPGDRWGTRCQREFIVVEPDGSLNSCPDRARHEPPFSNANAGAEAFIASDLRRNWIRVNDVTHREHHCHTCEFRSFCRSGCPVTPNGPHHGERECSGYKGFLLHVQQFFNDNPDHRQLLVEYGQMRRSGFEEPTP